MCVCLNESLVKVKTDIRNLQIREKWEIRKWKRENAMNFFITCGFVETSLIGRGSTWTLNFCDAFPMFQNIE